MAFKSVNEIDIIFISYDEDNCEENWADLLTKAPWAHRVHGVKGSDAAHKAAAALSTTEYFISVDADNKVDDSFFNLELDLEHPKLKGKAISWSAYNYINGLEYGNGGLKCWPTQYVLDMKTHENAEADDEKNQVDFCWEDSYVQLPNRYSTTFTNSTPRQAFRAGFREGVKMSLIRGKKPTHDEFKQRIWWGNYKRLITWCSVGADVENGLWSMYGALLGCYKTVLTDWDYINVRDFEYLNKMFEVDISQNVTVDTLTAEVKSLGNTLYKNIGLEVAMLDEAQSRFFKSAQFPTPRMNGLYTEAELNELRRINR